MDFHGEFGQISSFCFHERNHIWYHVWRISLKYCNKYNFIEFWSEFLMLYCLMLYSVYCKLCQAGLNSVPSAMSAALCRAMSDGTTHLAVAPDTPFSMSTLTQQVCLADLQCQYLPPESLSHHTLSPDSWETTWIQWLQSGLSASVWIHDRVSIPRIPTYIPDWDEY